MKFPTDQEHVGDCCMQYHLVGIMSINSIDIDFLLDFDHKNVY